MKLANKAFQRVVYKQLKKLYDSLSVKHKRRVYALLGKPFDLQNTVKINQPLILITQVQRSGGTLLTRLFDGHSELYTHPTEISCIKNEWLSLKDIKNLHQFYLRGNSYMQRYVYEGFLKGKGGRLERLPFDFNFGIQEKILYDLEPDSIREYLNTYFTSFFNAGRTIITLLKEKGLLSDSHREQI